MSAFDHDNILKLLGIVSESKYSFKKMNMVCLIKLGRTSNKRSNLCVPLITIIYSNF